MAKEDPEEKNERAHAAWTAEHNERMRKGADAQRRLGTLLGFPEVCSHARCRRTRECSGDVDACFRRYWPHVPEVIKNTMRRAITLVAGGMEAAEALRQAEAYAEERERKDLPGRGEPQAGAALVTRTQPPATRGPRIRSL